MPAGSFDINCQPIQIQPLAHSLLCVPPLHILSKMLEISASAMEPAMGSTPNALLTCAKPFAPFHF